MSPVVHAMHGFRIAADHMTACRLWYRQHPKILASSVKGDVTCAACRERRGW